MVHRRAVKQPGTEMMTDYVRCIAVAAALFGATAALAETSAPDTAPAAASSPVSLKSGLMLWSSEGKRIGRIERVITARDGTPVSASVIFDSRFVYVPVSTITASDSGVKTSLTRAEVSKLK
jgi:hypothetical protein